MKINGFKKEFSESANSTPSHEKLAIVSQRLPKNDPSCVFSSTDTTNQGILSRKEIFNGHLNLSLTLFLLISHLYLQKG